MSKQTFKIDDRVARATSKFYENDYSDAETVPLRYDEDNGLELGKVIDISTRGHITVKWDKNWAKDEVLEAEELMTEEAAKARWTELEKEFKEVEKQVAAKVKEVAKAIREANKLSRTVGRPLAQMGNDIIYRELYHAMDEAGWNTSSFGC